MGSIFVPFGHIFTDAMMTTCLSSASVNGTMSSIETSLTNTGSVDTLTMVVASLVTGLQSTSGSLPPWITDAGGSQTLTVRTTVKAANSLGRKDFGQKSFGII